MSAMLLTAGAKSGLSRDFRVVERSTQKPKPDAALRRGSVCIRDPRNQAVDAALRFRRHQPSTPPAAKITPGTPAPTKGPGTRSRDVTAQYQLIIVLVTATKDHVSHAGTRVIIDL